MAELRLVLQVSIDETNIIESSLDTEGFLALINARAHAHLQDILQSALAGDGAPATHSVIQHQTTPDDIRADVQALMRTITIPGDARPE